MSALPLVLLHGWGAHPGVWGELITHMALGHTVIAPDIPGYGDAPSLTYPEKSDRRCVVFVFVWRKM